MLRWLLAAIVLGVVLFGAWISVAEWLENKRRRRDDRTGWIAEGMALQHQRDMEDVQRRFKRR
jgi:hypothetical protein